MVRGRKNSPFPVREVRSYRRRVPCSAGRAGIRAAACGTGHRAWRIENGSGAHAFCGRTVGCRTGNNRPGPPGGRERFLPLGGARFFSEGRVRILAAGTAAPRCEAARIRAILFTPPSETSVFAAWRHRNSPRGEIHGHILMYRPQRRGSRAPCEADGSGPDF